MNTAVIVAGGSGTRMGRNINKQFLKIDKIEVLARTLIIFNSIEEIDDIILVMRKDDIDYAKLNIVDKYKINKISRIISGGIERQDSVYNGLIQCNSSTDCVIIHDGARPFITKEIIIKSINEALKYGACAAGMPVKDTIKIIDKDRYIIGTPDRNTLFSIQTPQAFKYSLILKAHKAAIEDNFLGTDDTVLVERLGYKVKMIEGSYSNIKITTQEDLNFGEAILKSRNGDE